MVLKIKRYVDIDGKTDADADANVPVGAPKPSHVRELLLKLKTRLEAQLNGNGTGSVGGTGNGHCNQHKNGLATNTERLETVRVADWSEAAGDLHDTVVERAVQDNIMRQLQQVNETLARIDEGKYGICTECLKSIAADRLVVRPFATLCLDCQNRLDRGKAARFAHSDRIHAVTRR